MNKFIDSIFGYLRDTNKLLWLFCLSASTYGCFLVYSATRTNGNAQIRMQILAISLGYIAAFIIARIDYHFISKLWPFIAVVCLALMMATSIWGETVAGTDDKAWLLIGGVSFQPSELVKIGFIVTFATHLSALIKAEKLKNFGHICLLLLHAGVPIGIIHLQGDDGAALMFFLMFLVMCFAAGVQLRYFLITFVAIAAAVPLLWTKVLNNDQKKRFEILFDHTIDPLHFGYQQEQGQISIGSGKLTGRGYLQGFRVASSVVPEDHNDFIYSVAGEEFGFIGCVLIIVILTLICVRTLMIATKAIDPLGRLICWGFFAMIMFQTICNIGMCLYILPVIGITLPFFSAGGSSAACLYLGVGLVQSVAMHSTVIESNEFSLLKN